METFLFIGTATDKAFIFDMQLTRGEVAHYKKKIMTFLIKEIEVNEATNYFTIYNPLPTHTHQKIMRPFAKNASVNS